MCDFDPCNWCEVSGTEELEGCNFVVFDLETTGFSPNFAEIIEVAAIKFDNGVAKDKFETFVKPRRGINPRAQQVNGITSRMVAGAPLFEDIRDSFINFVSDYDLVAHNAPFDVRFLQANNVILDNKIINTVKLAKSLPIEKHDLETVKKYLGMKITSHRALADCFVTAKLYMHCFKNQQF